MGGYFGFQEIERKKIVFLSKYRDKGMLASKRSGLVLDDNGLRPLHNIHEPHSGFPLHHNDFSYVDVVVLNALDRLQFIVRLDTEADRNMLE